MMGKEILSKDYLKGHKDGFLFALKCMEGRVKMEKKAYNMYELMSEVKK